MNGTSTLDAILEVIDDLRSAVEDLRDANPFALALIDAQIGEHQAQVIDLTAKRDQLIGWAPAMTGDWAVAREVARWMGEDHSLSWGRSATEAWLADQPEAFTASQMGSVLGPQWRHVVELVRKAASLTDTEVQAWRDVWWKDYDQDRASWDAAWRAVRVVGGPGGAALRALRAFVGVVFAGVGAALARRHEIEAHHYDRLTRAWRVHFGPIHIDDEDLG